MQHGQIDTIEIDLGRSFDGLQGFAKLTPDDQASYVASWRHSVAHLSADSPIVKRVEHLIAEATDPEQ